MRVSVSTSCRPADHHKRSGEAAPRTADLFDETYENVYRFCRARSGSHEVAQDVAAEVFAEAARRFADGNGEGISIAWLVTVARRRLIDLWRSNERSRRRLEQMLAMAQPDPVVEREADAAVQAALRSLPGREPVGADAPLSRRPVGSGGRRRSGVWLPGRGIGSGPRAAIIRKGIRGTVMTDRHDETTIREILRSVERSRVDRPEVMATARRQTLAVFDEAARRDGFDGDGVAGVFELKDADVRRRHPGTISLPLVVAAAIVVLAISGLSLLMLERDTPGETLATGEESPAEADASDLLAGLVLTLPEDDVTVLRTEPGHLVLELTGPRSPVGEPTELTLLLVDRWGPAMLSDTLPRVREPTSLNSWLALSTRDLATFVPFSALEGQADVESWVATLGGGNADCVELQPCGVVATSSGGGTVSLVSGLTNELTSVEFTNGPTILIHATYRDESDLSEPAGAEVVRSMRFD